MGKPMKYRIWLSAMSILLLAGCASNSPQPPWWAAASVVSPPPRHHSGAIYAGNDARNLYADVQARRAGDVITVLIDEQAVASKQASTKMDRQGSVDNGASAILQVPTPGRFDLKIGSKNKFSGSGQADQSSSFTSTLTAVVTHVLPNGNLVISGWKKMLLDHGPEIISLSGIVRPSSIGPDNVVSSSEVADETIRYTGQGALQDAQHMGWLQRLLMAIWPF